MNNEKNETVLVNKEEKNVFNKVIDFVKKVPYKPIIILVIVVLLAILVPKRLPSIFKSSNYTKVEKICNLATVEAYYHNVAIKEDPASSIGKIFGNIGYKKYWLEYDAIVQYGIDAKKVKIEKPNLKNEVIVHIPEAEILGEPELVIEYIKDPVTDTGFLTSVSGEDKTIAIENSIKELKANANKDNEQLQLARERAKKFFEKYIVNAGKEIGVDYKVIFED